MKVKDILRSTIDRSINVIMETDQGDKVEARAVQRTDETLIIYLSSDVGCNLSCRMCHLTQTGQTKSSALNVEEFQKQALTVFNLLKSEDRLNGLKTVHYNFMAQGDVMLNPNALICFENLHESLGLITRYFVPDAGVQYKLSTIFPKDSVLFNRAETDQSIWLRDRILSLDEDIEFYYSLYSLKPEFRKKWLPKAQDPEHIGRLFSGLDHGLRIHHALIAGQNDTEEDIALIHEWLERHDLYVKMNIVRYNPFDGSCGTESDEDAIQTYVNQMNLSHRLDLIQVIPKVGTDVFASCGMFSV